MGMSGWSKPIPRDVGFLTIGAVILLVALHKGFHGVRLKVS